jgi:hypothetical protein
MRSTAWPWWEIDEIEVGTDTEGRDESSRQEREGSFRKVKEATGECIKAVMMSVVNKEG